MDRVILISMATGMLSFHQRYSPIDPNIAEKDEMQLASYFSALQHVRDTFSKIESSDEIQYSIHEQGCSSWTTGLVRHSTGLYILAFYSKYIRFSTHFWKIVFPIMQKELTEAPLNSLDQVKSKRALQNILQIAWTKSINSLAQNLPFTIIPSVACELCGSISEKNTNSLLNIPSLQLSLKTASLSPVPLNSSQSSSTILEYISPRPKSVELRSVVEEVNEQSIGNHNIPVKSNNFWCCFGPASSVSAVSRNSVHLEPVNKNPTKLSSIPTENSPSLSVTSSPSPVIRCNDSKQFSRINFSSNEIDKIDYARLCQQYVTQPSEGKDSVKLMELDKDWNIVFHVHSLEDKNAGKRLNPPSPLTAMVEDRISQNNDLQLLCLEDDNPPSPPRKMHSSQIANDDSQRIEKYVIAVGPSMCTVFRLSFKPSTELNERTFAATQYINTFAVEEFHHCFHFCDERGWLNEKQQTLLV